ncbi:MAG: GNAT family N-acetyltransferase [Candidatus Coatesbacteria bacterium]|nr:MAG: GNAT family N-acetyltransferase [Candidatus Coatesbacteria bacterium]
MEEDVNIRDAREFDACAIAGLLEELGYPNTPEFVIRKLELLGDDDNPVFVAEAGGEIVGFVSLHIMPVFHEEPLYCRITAVAVTETYRRRGVGRRLMEHAEAVALAAACGRIELTSNERRTWAHVFYETLGYEGTSRKFVKTL